jgi:hypothetical protein
MLINKCFLLLYFSYLNMSMNFFPYGIVGMSRTVDLLRASRRSNELPQYNRTVVTFQ